MKGEMAAKGGALLGGILECPDDDMQRLVYADWLEECGDDVDRARAEFIRYQVLDPDAECLALSRRPLLWCDQEIFRAPPLSQPGAMVCWFFRRGFLDRAECHLTDFMAHAKALFSANPITSVVLTDRRPRWDEYGTCGPVGKWGWWKWQDHVFEPTDLPLGIWRRLTGGRRAWHGGRENRKDCGWRWYATEADALAALSRACVEYGRSTRRRSQVDTRCPPERREL